MADLASIRDTRRRSVGDMLRRESLREAAAKLGVAGACLFLCLGAVVRFAIVRDQMTGGLDALSAARLFAIACQTVLYLLVLWFTLIRRPALRRAEGWKPRIVASVGAFSVFGFGFLPPAQGLGIGWHLAASLLLLASAALGALVLVHLGRSFSLMSEARGLVTQGPYRFVRHPLYVVEELAVIAGFIEAMSVAAALLLAAQIAFQLRRILNEEAVLGASFPDYARYKEKTARVIPGIW